MSLGARLYHANGYEVGVGQAWGTAMYGIVGFGIGVSPGFPLFHTGDLFEFTEEVASVPGGVYGTQMYGAIGVRLRQGHPSVPVTSFSIGVDKAFSPEFVEDELLAKDMRLLEDQSVFFEISEVAWPS
jgi:hypothetical protein